MRPKFSFASSSSRPSPLGWVCLVSLALGFGALGLHAQALPAGRTSPGIGLYSTFEGSSSISGTVFDMSNTVSYNFTKHLGVDLTVPVYFVLPPLTPVKGIASSTTGLGNVALDAHLTIPLLFVDYSPTGTIAFPTGSTTKGFSTGAVTYDLDNRFEHDFGIVSPFIEVDIGNSVNNMSSPRRRVIRRPFLTFGNMAQFTAGPEIQILGRLTVSADAYKVVPWGPQTVFSRIVKPGKTGVGGTHHRVYEISQITGGGANLVEDDGFDASIAFSPTRYLDLTVAANHSIFYSLDTISLSVGLNVSQILARSHR